ncbi:MAG: carboxypeptidase regulatory-like domain-containing protein [Tessaracoccus sp.]|uniref:carboxypeptidase-like regulatory domain-containing protein n=1 Tax=Tessaracoccus sp. TaxID=1971211 RepID=UPI001EC9FD08|nr:carboxypeptidase-like regulatory domain-containing protein [Tessaracoccus sp.]MBK7820305.1 carboxypeptidase regulatory-like domain-containing protein [Tessaracoccus sp.]
MKKAILAAALAVALALTGVGVMPAHAKTDATGTVKITVQTAGGAPVAGVDVSLDGDGIDDWEHDSWAYGETNASGVFQTGELAPGDYDLTAQLWSPDSKKTDRVKVEANKDISVVVTLTGIQVLKGKVTAKGKVVTGGYLHADGGKAGYYRAEIVKGEYSVIVKPGSYTVFAEPRWDEAKTWVTTYAGNTVRAVDSAKQKVADSPKTVNIAAYDKLGKVSGTVLDAKGKPAKNTSVWASAKNRTGYASAMTDSKGRYTLTGLPADSYNVAANTADSSASKTVKVNVDKTAKADLKLKKDATAPKYKGKIILTLKAPSALVKAGNACAVLFNSKGFWTHSGCLSADGKGKTITFDRLPAGTYTVALAGANVTKSVTLKKDKTAKLSMTRAAGTTISGKVTNHKGKAVAGASVYVTDANGIGMRSVQTNSKGVYKVSGILKGKYTVRASSAKVADGVAVTKSLTSKGKKVTLNLKLIKAATITGKVTDSKGKAVAGVEVEVWGNGWGRATTDAKGAYKVTGLGEGTYTVTTQDLYVGGYFNGTSSSKKVGKGKTVAFSVIKLKS